MMLIARNTVQRNNTVRQQLYNSPFTAVVLPSAPKAENADVTGTVATLRAFPPSSRTF